MTTKKSRPVFLYHFPMMVAHLMKVSPYGKFSVLLDTVLYLLGFFRWRIPLAFIQPLNWLRETSLFTRLRKQMLQSFFRKRLVQLSLPVNLELLHRNRFLNNFYLLRPLKILTLKNHWIDLNTYHGIVFDNFHLLPVSVHGRWDRRNVILLKDYFRGSANALMYSKHEEDGMIELNDEKNYLLVHHWFNFYHWFTETLLRLWWVKDRLNHYTILLPESFREIDFVQQSLKALNAKNILYIKGVLQIRNLTLVENKPYCNHYYPQLTREIGEYFAHYVKQSGQQDAGFGEKIFITRKKAERRKLVNEDEVERVLSEYGFKSFAPEDFNFLQQVAIVSNVKYFIGMHGAGLTNMLFMPQGGRVLELHREIYSRDDLHSDIYWKLAGALGHRYFYQFCDAMKKDEDFFTVDYHVDINKFRLNLEQFLK